MNDVEYPPELQLPEPVKGEGWHGNGHYTGGECDGWVTPLGLGWKWVAGDETFKFGYENTRELAMVRVTRQIEAWDREDLAAFIQQHRDECIQAFAETLVRNAPAIEAWAMDRLESEDGDVAQLAFELDGAGDDATCTLSDRTYATAVASDWLDRIHSGPLDADAQFIADFCAEAVESVRAKVTKAA